MAARTWQRCMNNARVVSPNDERVIAIFLFPDKIMQDIKCDCNSGKNYRQPQAYFAGDGYGFACLDVITQGNGE